MFCLKSQTDPRWADYAARNLDAVLVDHAHCEMKAASNALALVARYPSEGALSLPLTELAKEEISHFQEVVRLLEPRGLRLGPPHVDSYAAELRQAAATLPPPRGITPLIDRLLVAALIEARSCERFKLLMAALPPCDADVQTVYEDLFPAEARHYRLFVDLALAVANDACSVQSRLHALSELESVLLERLAATGLRATIHG